MSIMCAAIADANADADVDADVSADADARTHGSRRFFTLPPPPPCVNGKNARNKKNGNAKASRFSRTIQERRSLIISLISPRYMCS